MKPKKTEHKPQRELFRVELSFLVDANHPLVKLGGRINWKAFEEHLEPTYHDKTGALGIDTRLMVALHYLKYQHDLGDAAVVAGWVENPYWQHFSGRQYFEHGFSVDPSSMTRWRKRLAAYEPVAQAVHLRRPILLPPHPQLLKIHLLHP